MRGLGRRARLALALGAAGACAAAPARADLEGDARELTASFEKAGSVRRLTPRFVERGGLRPLLLPGDWLDPLREDCVTVVVLGAPSTTFLLRFLPARDALGWPAGEHPELSVGGAAQLVRCGVRKAMLGRLALEMRSPRAVVELIVARGERPFPPLTRVLTGRSPGAFAPLGVAGPRARSEPLESRVRAHSARARKQGASALGRRDLSADGSGRGRASFELEVGCHRVTVLGDDAANAPVDVDAELAVAASAEPVASDRSEAPDAVLSTCVGRKSVATVSFEGAAPSGAVTLLAERHELPTALPARWAPEDRARVAQALRQHQGPPVLGPLVWSARGVSGITLLPLELEPDACYVATAAAVRGRVSGIALSAELGQGQAQNHGGLDALGTTLAFCARGEAFARVTVEVRGEGAAWLFGLFRAGRAPVGEQAE